MESPILKRARLVAPNLKVAFQGGNFSFSHLASLQFFNGIPQVEFEGFASVSKVFSSVIDESGCVYGVLPVESSTQGTIHRVFDQILASNDKIKIVGEIGMMENYCLCSRHEIISDRELNGIIGKRCMPYIIIVTRVID